MVKTARADDAQTLASFADEPDRMDVNAEQNAAASAFTSDEQLPDQVANVSRDEIRKYVQCKRVGNYLLGKTVGEGSFAKVKEALHIPTGEKVAIKIIDKNRARKDRYVSKNMRREARLLQMIRHPHIVQLLEVVETTQCYYLVFEFADGGDLMDYICKRRKLDEEEVKKFIRQIISAVEYIHRLGIIHRDLKVENLLLDANKNIKIIDFGLSNTIFSSDPKNENHCTTQCGSPAYAAPELLVRKDYGPQIDVWSIGVNMYAMLTGRLPYTCEPFNISTLYHKMLMKEMNSVPEYLTEGCKDFIHQLLNPNPVERVSLLQATRNKWLTNDQNEPILLITCPNYLREEDLDDRILDHVESALKLNSDDVVRDVIQNRATRNSCVYYLLLRRLNRYRREYKDIMGSVPRSPPPTTTMTPTTTTSDTTTASESDTPEPVSPPPPPESCSKPAKTHIIENPFKTLKVALIRQKKASKGASKSTKSVTFSAPKTSAAVADSNNQLCEVKKVALVKVAPAKRSFRGVLSSARNLTSGSSSSVGGRRKSYFDSLQQRRKSPKVRRRNPDSNDDSRSSIGSNSQTSVLSKTAREAVRRRSQVMELTLHEGKVSNHNSPRNTITDEPACKPDAVAEMDVDVKGSDVECVEALLESLAEYKDENMTKTMTGEAEKRPVADDNKNEDPTSEVTAREGNVGVEDPAKTTGVDANKKVSVDERTRASTGAAKTGVTSEGDKFTERSTLGADAATTPRPLNTSAGQSRRTSVDSSRLSVSTKGSSGSSVERKGTFKSGSRVSFTGSRLDLRSSGGSVDIKVNGARDENGEVIKEIGRLVNARISSITNRMSGEKFKPINDVYDKTRPVSGGGLASLRSGSSRSNLSRREPMKPTYQLPSARTNTYRQPGALNNRTAALTNRYVAKTRNEPSKLSDKYTKFLTVAADPNAKLKQSSIGQKNLTRSELKKPGAVSNPVTTNQDIIPNWRKNLKKVDESKNGVVTRSNKVSADVQSNDKTAEKAPRNVVRDQKANANGRTTTNDGPSKTQHVQNKLSAIQDTKTPATKTGINAVKAADTKDDTSKRVSVDQGQRKDQTSFKDGEKSKGSASKTQRNGSKDLNEGINAINELNTKRSQILLRRMDVMDPIVKAPEAEDPSGYSASLKRASDVGDKSRVNIDSGAVEISTSDQNSVKQGSEVRKLNAGLTKQHTNAENKKEAGTRTQAYLQKTRTQNIPTGSETKNVPKPVYGLNKNGAAPGGRTRTGNDKARSAPNSVVKDAIQNTKRPSTATTEKNTGKVASVERRSPRITDNNDTGGQPRRNSATTERRGSATAGENPVERLRRNFAKPQGETNKAGQTLRRNSTKTGNGSTLRKTPTNSTASSTERNKTVTPRRNSAKTENQIGSAVKKTTTNATASSTDKNKPATPRRNSTKSEATPEGPGSLTNGAKGLRRTENKTSTSATTPLKRNGAAPTGDQKASQASLNGKKPDSTKNETESTQNEENSTKPGYGLRKTPSSTKPTIKDNGVLPSRSREPNSTGSTVPTATHGNVHSLRKSLTATFGETVKSGANKINNTANRSAYGLHKTPNAVTRKYSEGQSPKHDDVLRKTSWTGGERRQIAAYRASNGSLHADDGKELKPVGPIPTYRRTAYKSCS